MKNTLIAHFWNPNGTNDIEVIDSDGKSIDCLSEALLKNRDIPRSGIVNASSLYPDLFDDCLNRGIDLTWESYKTDRLIELTSENPELDENEIQDLFDNDSGIDFDSHVFLYGAWVKNDNGQYEIDKSGEHGSYALEYNTETGIVCIEWSLETTLCHHTSPCYVMSDGSGPCGDLDTPGDSVVAYTLPSDMFHK